MVELLTGGVERVTANSVVTGDGEEREVDAIGRNSMLWPDWTWRFRQRTASFDPTDFELTHRRTR